MRGGQRARGRTRRRVVRAGARRQLVRTANADDSVVAERRRHPLAGGVLALGDDSQVALLAELAAHNRPRARRHVAGYPPPTRQLGGDGDIRAARETVQNQIARVRRRLDNPPGERLRLLRRIPRSLPGLRTERPYVRPDIRRNLPRVGGEIALDSGHPALPVGPVNHPREIQRVQPRHYALYSSVSGDDFPLYPFAIRAFAGNRPAAMRSGRVDSFPRLAAFAVPYPRPGKIANLVLAALVFEPIKPIHVIRIERDANGVAVYRARSVKQNRVANRSVSAGIVVRRRSFPDDFILEFVHAEHGVHHLAKVAVGFVVAVQIDAAVRFQDAPDFERPLDHEGDIGGDAVAVGVARRLYQQVSAGADGFEVVHPVFIDSDLEIPNILEIGGRAFLVGIFEPHLIGGIGVVNAPRVHQLALDAPLFIAKRRAQAARKRLILPKRRVDADEVDASRIQRLEERQVVANEDGSVEVVGVEGGHVVHD